MPWNCTSLGLVRAVWSRSPGVLPSRLALLVFLWLLIDENDVYKRSRNFCPGVSQYIHLKDYFRSIFHISKVTSFTPFLPKGGKCVSLLQHHADPAAHLLGARPGLAFLRDRGGSWSERPRSVLSPSHPRTGAWKAQCEPVGVQSGRDAECHPEGKTGIDLMPSFF